jgi:hypothetical protein
MIKALSQIIIQSGDSFAFVKENSVLIPEGSIIMAAAETLHDVVTAEQHTRGSLTDGCRLLRKASRFIFFSALCIYDTTIAVYCFNSLQAPDVKSCNRIS